MTELNSTELSFLLGGVGKGSTGGLLPAGEHVVIIVDMKPNLRKPFKKDGTPKGWSDPTFEVIVTLASDEGATTMWVNPQAFKRPEDVTADDIKAIIADPSAMKKLGLKKADFANKTFEQQYDMLFKNVCVDEDYNADDFYAVRKDNNQRVVDPIRSAKGRQIMDRLAVHAGLCQEGEAYDSILEAKGREIGILIETSASGGTKVARTMPAEDVTID